MPDEFLIESKSNKVRDKSGNRKQTRNPLPNLLAATGQVYLRATLEKGRAIRELQGAVDHLTGFSPGDVPSDFGWDELIVAEDRATVWSAMQRLKPGERYSIRYRVDTPRGRKWCVEDGFRCGGSTAEIEALIRDATTENKLTDDIEQQRFALEDALLQQDETLIELQAAREQLLQTNELLEEVQRVAKLGYWVLDLESWTFEWSDEIFQIWGRDLSKGAPSYKEYLETIPEPYRNALHTAGQIAVETGETFEVEHRVDRPDGDVRWVRLNGRVLGHRTRMIGAAQDITSRRHLEEQLRQSQKMEAIGRLAGGVAHDFNNVLTAIFSFTEFAMEGLEEDDVRRADLMEVLGAASRAKELTSQLLTFSRRRTVQPRTINVNDTIQSARRMLSRLIGEDVAFHTDLAPELWDTSIDPGALEQVLMNLAVNARDAMPDGGEFSVRTENARVRVPIDMEADEPMIPGEYVLLAIRDTGVGMDARTQERVFEPFFTTKPQGEGTGLGLSTCFGIVRQAEGYITVESEVGRGSTFSVYLPRDRNSREHVDEEEVERNLTGDETVLVVEDDRQVRELALRALQHCGYHPIEAISPDEAIAIIETYEGHIDLLLTDVVMPEMNGHELAEAVIKRRPDIQVLYMSGYSEDAVSKRGVVDDGVHLLQKPFVPERLVAAVRATLDGGLETTLH